MLSHPGHNESSSENDATFATDTAEYCGMKPILSRLIGACRKHIGLILYGSASAACGYVSAEYLPMAGIDLAIVFSRHAVYGAAVSEKFLAEIQKIIPPWTEERRMIFPITVWTCLGSGCIAKYLEHNDWKDALVVGVTMATSSSIAALIEFGLQSAQKDRQ